ncbi:MAG: hypothetical protein DMF28_05295 [Verrucomicrobia bacterium]|nr:MAG: hypothetical protein DMF28_05295 [Verrucomicrobiota bacterium]
MSSKRIHAAWFGIHFFLITAVCLAGVFWLIAQGSTILPSACNEYAQKAELGATWCLGKEAGASNPVRRGIATYLHAAGIQAGYSFFAPNVPSQHRLTLELLYEDGSVEYESPYEPVREALVKRLAFSVWREHPDVKKIRAVFGSVTPPGMTEFEHGKADTFQPMFSFDFSLRDEQKQ